MSTIEYSESIPKKGVYDVIVAGGGVAGAAAALSARRAGKRPLLIEKTTLLGGLATIGLVNLFVPMCNGRGKTIIKGMAEELLRLSIKYGYDSIPEDWKGGEPKKPTNQRYMTKFSPNIFALALAELLSDEGVAIRFDSSVSGVVTKDGRCEGLIVDSKSGREFFECGVAIDATGDANLLFKAGVPTVQGKNYFTCYGFAITLESCKAAAESGDIKKAFTWASGGGASLYGDNHPAGMKLFSGVDAGDISEYLLLNQRKMLEKLKGDARGSRDVVTLPTMAQFRTTRRIDGDYTLKTDDCYKHFPDSVGAICDFDRRDFLYEIPYRSLCRAGYSNIITAGRCAAGEGYAWDVLRVIPPAIISGQAAGAAAALALDTGKPIPGVDVAKLQDSLAKAGVMLHFDDALIPAKTADDVHADIGHI